MTASAVVPPTAVPAAPRAAATSPRESSVPTDGFDRQLHAARQQREPAQDSADASSPKSIHASKDTQSDASPQATVADASGTATTPLTGAAVTTVTVATAASSHQADPGRDTHVDGDQAGAALAGSMLALLGLSSGVAPAAAAATSAGETANPASTGTAGKTVTSDAGAAAWLQANALDSGSAATAIGAALPSAGTQPAGDEIGLPPVAKAADRSADLASVLGLPATVAAAAPAVTHQLQLPSSVGSQAFAHELGQQVVWLTGQDVKQARIRLHPEELGQLDVKINVSHDRVDVVFSAQHPAAVTAIQQSLSQLGQMLTQQGLSLGHAEVGQHDHGKNHGSGGATPNDAAVDDTDEVHGVGLRTSIGAVGLLDAFA
jgi:flagellar hook-length control protein FliK